MNDAHTLADFVCKRSAEKKKIVLPQSYWNTDYWGKEYKKSIIAAHAILKIYPLSVVLSSLNHPSGRWITSLRARQLHDLCRDEQKRHEQIKEKIRQSDAPILTNTTSLPTKRKSNNKIDKLK